MHSEPQGGLVSRIEYEGMRFKAIEDMDATVPDVEGYSPSKVETMGDSQSEAVTEEEGGAVESFTMRPEGREIQTEKHLANPYRVRRALDGRSAMDETVQNTTGHGGEIYKGELHGSFVAIDEVQGLYIARDKAKQNFRLPGVSELEEQSMEGLTERERGRRRQIYAEPGRR
ncbi:hypothetical protein B0H14DRAFT_2600260 [Mycena olivaceomarginata]|nr:hypothetical protein B0H14DRAFT_2600260 [Mycena olivaceomarginata]